MQTLLLWSINREIMNMTTTTPQQIIISNNRMFGTSWTSRRILIIHQLHRPTSTTVPFAGAFFSGQGQLRQVVNKLLINWRSRKDSNCMSQVTRRGMQYHEPALSVKCLRVNALTERLTYGSCHYRYRSHYSWRLHPTKCRICYTWRAFNLWKQTYKVSSKSY